MNKSISVISLCPYFYSVSCFFARKYIISFPPLPPKCLQSVQIGVLFLNYTFIYFCKNSCVYTHTEWEVILIQYT